MSEEWITYDDIEDMDSEALATFLEILEKATERDQAERIRILEARQEYLINELAEAINDLEHEWTAEYEHCVLPGEDNHRLWIVEELDQQFGKV